MRFNIHVLVLGSNTPLVTRTHGNRARPLRYAFAPALRVREIAFQRTIAYGRVRLRAITYGRVRLRVQFRVLPRAIYTREYTRAREAFYTGKHADSQCPYIYMCNKAGQCSKFILPFSMLLAQT
jgi:hypothetical protein